MHRLSADRNYPADLLKLAVTGNFGLIQDYTNKFRKKMNNLGPASQINPNFPATANLKRSTGEFCLLREDE